ncbi:Small, acid-soluble spore protein L [Brevibacillus sp. IT-7CA2]
MTDRNSKEKPDMGYNGSNMHGYSLTPKEGTLDQTTKTAAAKKENRDKE